MAAAKHRRTFMQYNQNPNYKYVLVRNQKITAAYCRCTQACTGLVSGPEATVNRLGCVSGNREGSV